MSHFGQGLKSTLFSIGAISIVFFLISELSMFWQSWLVISQTLVFVLLAITFLFAAQFSRSRISLLACFWLIFYLIMLYQPDIFTSLNFTLGSVENGIFVANDQLMLVGLLWFTLLSVSKNRGLLSVHSLYKFLSFIGIMVISSLWLLLSKEIESYLLIHYQINLASHLSVELPLVCMALLALWQSIKSACLLSSAILSSMFIWSLYYYQLLEIPWSITLCVLLCHYLLVVIIDSYFLAYRDELTGLPSRRALYQLVLSLGRNYSVAMLDIDHFKKFNDKYGHDIGDQVLKLVASKIAKVKGGGRAFRYGGEEFAVIFPRKDAIHSANELDLLRQAIASYKMIIRHPQRKSKEERKKNKKKDMKSVSVTISIGVAMKEHKQSFEQVLKSADLALYRAKKNGRNNVSY